VTIWEPAPQRTSSTRPTRPRSGPGGDLEADLIRVVGERLTRRTEATADGRPLILSAADRRQLALTEIQRALDELDEHRLETGESQLPAERIERLTTVVLNRLFGLGGLQDYIDDAANTDIFVNGYDRVRLRRRDGSVINGSPVAASDEELIEMIQAEARRGRNEHRWDPASPELNLQLPSGDRLHAIAWVSSRPSISIRRHNFELNRLGQLVGYGTINDALHHLLQAMVRARMNILVAGGTGAGKTTLLRCLINEIPPEQRIVTVEDNLELGLNRFSDLHPDHVELEARRANTEGRGEVTMHDLVRSALRMGPDRVIVGEIRGAEVVPMFLAMSQGNDGSMSTLHANSSESVFRRIHLYLAMAPERGDQEAANLLTSNAVDFIVHITSLRTGERVITSVREVTGIEGPNVASQETFAPDSTGRAVPRFRPTQRRLERLVDAGFDPGWLDATEAHTWGRVR
jgi:Flp pilus assembly CpaF family ATPase